MELWEVIEDLNEQPIYPRSYYEYPVLYEFFHSRVLSREGQVELLKRFQPENTNRVLEFGCGTGPLLVRIEDEYEEVLGIDSNDAMLDRAREKVTTAEVQKADFTEWCAATETRVFDITVLMGGLLHLTEDQDVDSLAENAYASLREGGIFLTFFAPLNDEIENGNEDVQTVESDRYKVERRSISAITSAKAHHTTSFLFTISDKKEETEARMGTVFHSRFHARDELRGPFSAAGFEKVDVIDQDGPTLLHAVR